MIIIKVLVMIIVIWLKLCSTHTSFFKISFLCVWVNKVVVFKNFRSLLNLFQIDGPINEILLWPKLLFFRLISKIDDPINELLHWLKLLFSRLILQGICDLVLHIFVEETSRSFIKNAIFSLPFQTFRIQKGKGKWNNLWGHELACIKLQICFLE